MISPTPSHSAFSIRNDQEQDQDDCHQDLEPIRLIVKGMSCAACTVSIETSLKSNLNVKSVTVSLFQQTVTIHPYKEQCEYSLTMKSIEIIRSLGFTVLNSSTDWRCRLEAKRLSERRDLKERLTFFSKCVCFGIPIIISSHMHMISLLFRNIIGALFSAPLHLYVALDIYKIGFKANNMERLILISCASSMLFSLIFITSDHGLFDCAAIILIIFSASRYLEGCLRRKILAGAEGDRLYKLPEMVRSKGKLVKVEMLKPGLTIEVISGDLVPTDGEVASGEIFVNEATLTGEAEVKIKREGDRVYGGTIIESGNGMLTVTKSLENSFLYKLGRQVFDLEEIDKEKTTSLADEIIQFFIPGIVALSALTFISWFIILFLSRAKPSDLIPEWRLKGGESSILACSFYFGLTVLCIACPCAISIATPIAISIAKSCAFKQGILIRDGRALDKIKDLNTIIFDKTGTLTTGKLCVTFEVVDGMNLNDFSFQEIMEICNLVEREHLNPVAQSIYKYTKSYLIGRDRDQTKKFELIESENVSGQGVKGRVKQLIGEGKTFDVEIMKLNNLEFESDERGKTSDNRNTNIQTQPISYSAVYIDKVKVGEFKWSDELKPEAREVISHFKRKGFIIGILSGDQQGCIDGIKNQFLPDSFNFALGNCRPEDKFRIVNDLIEQGHRVMFCGDGINDSLAMSRAHLSISFDPTASYTSVNFMRGSLNLLPKLFSIGRHLHRQIRMNLLWSLLYNSITIPFAMGFGVLIGLPPLGPEIGTILMGLSGISILVTSLLLKILI